MKTVKLKELLQRWKDEDDKLMMRIMYMEERDFTAEQFVLSKIRDAMVKRRIDLENVVGEIK